MRLHFLVSLALAACATPTAPPKVARTEVTAATDGTITILGTLDGQPSVALRSAAVRARVDGSFRTTRGAACSVSGPALLDCDLGDGLHLSLAQTTADDGTTLRATLTSEASHVVDGFEVLATAPGGLELAKRPAQLRYLHNGFQSWSFAGALDLTPGLVLPRQADAITYAAPDGVIAFDEHLGLSSHDVVLDAGDGSAFVVGFTSVDLWHAAVALEAPDTGLRITAFAGFTGDSVHVDATHPVLSEALFVTQAATPGDAMTRYGRAIDARRDHARDGQDFGQRGWFSWNRYFTEIDEPTVMKQAALLKGLGGPGFDLVEIDDGWERLWGDWRTNAKFRPVAQLSADLKSNAQRLGLWVAPFVVDATLPVVAEHPDWWVQTRTGKPLEHTPFGLSMKLRVVDTTHPDALAWAVENLVSLQRDGCDFFKLDFLYAASMDGVRHDPEATGAAALRLGLAAVFDALKTSHVNLCGVPWLHGALAPNSSLRIGSDVASNAAPYGWVWIAGAVRNLAARAFGPLAARSDIDQFWLEPLDDAETRTALTYQLLTPSTFALAEDFAAISAGKRTLIRQALLRAGQGFGGSSATTNVFDEAGAELIGSPAVEAFADAKHTRTIVPSRLSTGSLVAVTNWSDDAAETTTPVCEGVGAFWDADHADETVSLAAHDTELYDVSSCAED